MIDAHCHLDSLRFDLDREDLLTRARNQGVSGFMVAGVDPAGWQRQRQLSAQHSDVYSFYGIHPWAAASWSVAEIEDAMTQLSACVTLAVGELGLDRSRRVPADSLPQQELAFRSQLALARERDLPVVLHVVRAHGRVLEILRSDGLPARGGMVHSFHAAEEVARDYEELGLHLSFSGSITHPAAHRAARALHQVSTERLLIETDCPDQLPQGLEGERNRPEHLTWVARCVADVRGESLEQVQAQTTRNAVQLFGLTVPLSLSEQEKDLL